MSVIDQHELRHKPFQAHWAMARGDFAWIDPPVLSEIIPGLWVGGAPEPLLPEGFDFVLNLFAPFAHYACPDSTEVWDVRGIDDNEEPDGALLIELAVTLNERLDRGQRCLVHCQAGLNRSATVAALALMLRGMSAPDAIRLLRERRDPHVLCNPHLESFLLDLTPEELRAEEVAA